MYLVVPYLSGQSRYQVFKYTVKTTPFCVPFPPGIVVRYCLMRAEPSLSKSGRYAKLQIGTWVPGYRKGGMY